MLEIESDSDVDTESVISVESYDPQQLEQELDSMMLDIDLKKQRKAEQSDNDSIDDMVPGMPYQELCLVDDDDMPAGIQGVPATDASAKMVKTKLSTNNSKTMNKLQKMFEEESL